MHVNIELLWSVPYVVRIGPSVVNCNRMERFFPWIESTTNRIIKIFEVIYKWNSKKSKSFSIISTEIRNDAVVESKCILVLNRFKYVLLRSVIRILNHNGLDEVHRKSLDWHENQNSKLTNSIILGQVRSSWVGFRILPRKKNGKVTVGTYHFSIPVKTTAGHMK